MLCFEKGIEDHSNFCLVQLDGIPYEDNFKSLLEYFQISQTHHIKDFPPSLHFYFLIIKKVIFKLQMKVRSFKTSVRTNHVRILTLSIWLFLVLPFI